jgi:putative ABC transport system permease protein
VVAEVQRVRLRLLSVRGVGAWFEDARGDTAYAVRSLRRSPGFTAAAVISLAVGIGATTAISSVVDAVLLQPLPFPDADRLVRIVENDRPRTLPQLNYQEYLEWRSRTTTLSGLAAATFNPQAMMPTRAGTVRVSAGLVSSNYFEVLEAEAMLGRTLVSRDDANPDVAVLSFDTWQKYFGADPAAVGSAIEFRSGSLAGRVLTIVGVMPEGMEQLGAPLDFYTPIVSPQNGRPVIVGPMIGRLREGVPLTAAAQEANGLGHALRPPRPASAPPLTKPRFEAQDLKDDIVASLKPALRAFVIAVAVVLMIVCANVANLLLARGTARRREIAVRLAIGASRGRIVRQILTECLVLALGGGVIGALLGAVGVSLVKNLATIEAEGVFRIVFGATILPRAHEVGIDLRLLGIAFALAAATSVVFGLLPAFHLARINHLQAMGARGSGTARRDTRVRMVLVVAQLAMATTLLVGAGLLSNSFVKLASVEKGYDPTHVLAFQLALPDEYSTARKAESIEAVLARVRAMPGVAVAGFAYAGILIGIQDTVGSFVPPGRTLAAVAADPDRPRLKSISPGYLEAVGARVLDGRLLMETDSATAPPVIVINRTVARRYFGAARPVGSYMEWHGGRGAPVRVQVVGLIEDVRQASLAREPYAEIFMNFPQLIAIQQGWGADKRLVDQLAFGFMSFAMRTHGDPRDAIPAVRQAVTSVDPNAGIDAIVPMTRLVANSVARQRFYAVVVGVFAGVAALLAAIGIYGVLAYAVIQRTQEIGIRIALGAGTRQVLNLVLRRGLLLAAVGIGLGLAGAVVGTRYLQGMLFGITPLDGVTFAVVAVGFTSIASLASYMPARRATQVDPVLALRSE